MFHLLYMSGTQGNFLKWGKWGEHFNRFDRYSWSLQSNFLIRTDSRPVCIRGSQTQCIITCIPVETKRVQPRIAKVIHPSEVMTFKRLQELTKVRQRKMYKIYLAFRGGKKKSNDYKNTSSKNTRKASPAGKGVERTGIWMSKLQCQGGPGNWSCVTDYTYPRSLWRALNSNSRQVF